jgi:polyphosphate kinase 2 (PPK2 family)
LKNINDISTNAPDGINKSSANKELKKLRMQLYPHLPEKGMMEIFNRSHYEDILFPVVHHSIKKKEIEKRHEVISHLEDLKMKYPD